MRTDAQVVKHDEAYSLFALPIRVKRRCQDQDWINLAQTKIHCGALKHGNYVSSLTRNKFHFTSGTTENFQTTGSRKHLFIIEVLTNAKCQYVQQFIPTKPGM